MEVLGEHGGSTCSRQPRPTVVARSSGCRRATALEDRELQRRIDARRFPRSTASSPSCDRADGDGRYRSRRPHVPGRDQHLRRRDDGRPASTIARSSSRVSHTFDIRDFGMEPPEDPDAARRARRERAGRDHRREGGLTPCTSSVSARRSSTPSSSTRRRAARRAREGARRAAAPCAPGGVRSVVRGRGDGHRRARTPPQSSCCSRSRARCGELRRRRGTTDEIPLACPTCGSVDVELTGGDELMLESIEYRALERATRSQHVPRHPGSGHELSKSTSISRAST